VGCGENLKNCRKIEDTIEEEEKYEAHENPT
jgi:hypothetical protein